MKKRLDNKVAIVMGAGTNGEGLGNGKAVALQFCREGASVLCVDRDASALDATISAIEEEGNKAEGVLGNIGVSIDCKNVVAKCLAKYHKIDILYNNIGVPSYKDILDVSEETWNNIFNININGMFNICKYTIPNMIERNNGVIINVSSVASIRSFPDAAYVSSKGAVNALTIYLAGRYGRYNIRSNALILGYIETPLAQQAWNDEKIRKNNLKQVPMRRFGSPMEVARVAAFLASDEASYINGSMINIDGGLTIRM